MISLKKLPGQVKNEKTIKIIRRDLFILFKKILFIFLLIMLPIMVFEFIVLCTYPDILSGQIAYPAIVLITSFYYLFIWLFSFFSFLDYYLDVWIITNERIIDIQQKGFFSRIISEQRLYRVQDVTSEIQGLFSTILRYGDVHVQTAGAKQRFLFHEVPEPEKTKDLIIKLIERKKKNNKDAII